MILWQFILLMILLVVCEWATETRDRKRNELLNRLLHQLPYIENRLFPISDLPADIARAIYREGESRRIFSTPETSSYE